MKYAVKFADLPKDLQRLASGCEATAKDENKEAFRTRIEATQLRNRVMMILPPSHPKEEEALSKYVDDIMNALIDYGWNARMGMKKRSGKNPRQIS